MPSPLQLKKRPCPEVVISTKEYIMKYNKTKYPNIFTYETTKGKRYYVRRGYFLQGKKKEASKSNLKTLAEARNALAEIERKIENNEFAYNKNLTVDQYWNIYSDKMIKTNRWAPDTESNKFTIYNNHFQPIYGKVKMKDVLRDEYELYINRLLLTHSKHTVRQMHGIFVALLNDAVTCKYLDDNPVDGIYIGESQKAPQNKRITLEEFKIFDKAARKILSDYDYTMVRLTYFGLRRSEVLGLTLKSPQRQPDGRYALHLTQSRTRLRQSKGMKTMSSERIALLDEETSQLLEKAIQESKRIAAKYGRILGQDDYLFLVDYPSSNCKGQPLPPERLKNLFLLVEKESSLHITPHMMRHFFATQGIISGVPIEHMAAALGHSTSYMTSKYTHIKDEVASSVTDNFMKVIQ